MEVRIYNEMAVYGSVTFAKNELELPLVPKEGQMVLMNGRHYAYTKIATDYYSWLPTSVKQSSFIHVQGVASTTWTIAHNLNTVSYGLFVYDTDHNVVLCNHTATDPNTVSVTLSEAMVGSAVFFAVTDFSATNFNSANLTVGGVTLTDSSGSLAANGDLLATQAYVTTQLGDIQAALAALLG